MFRWVAVFWTVFLPAIGHCQSSPRILNTSSYTVPPTAHCNVVLQGESIMSGFEQSAGHTVADVIKQSLPGSTVVYDLAAVGRQIGPSGTNGTMLQRYSAMPGGDAIYFEPGISCNVYVVFPGLNDIANGRTTSDVETDLTTLIGLAKATGYTVGVVDEISRISLDSSKNTLNTWMASNVPQAGVFLIDVAANANLGADGSYTNTTYYQPDGIHLTDAGAAIFGGIIGSAVKSYTPH